MLDPFQEQIPQVPDASQVFFSLQHNLCFSAAEVFKLSVHKNYWETCYKCGFPLRSPLLHQKSQAY